MPKYICLVRFTQEGIKNLKMTTKRADAFAQKIAKKGVEISNTFWTAGHYDIIHIFEAPDDEVAACFAWSLGVLGNVRAEILRAYESKEMERIIGQIYSPYDVAVE